MFALTTETAGEHRSVDLVSSVSMEALQQNPAPLAALKSCLYDDEPLPSLNQQVSPIRNFDRVVVVTGVSSGIGLAITKVLVGHQCHVFGRYALQRVFPYNTMLPLRI